MKLICAPKDYAFPAAGDALEIILYGSADTQTRGGTGAAVRDENSSALQTARRLGIISKRR